MASTVAAHGGAATLQLLGPERINPGGTLDILGDMRSEGPVEMSLVAVDGGATRPLGTVSADQSGHFRAFLVVPTDVPSGAYAVMARMLNDEASTPVIVAGPAVTTGEEGQPLGQDEALAGRVLASAVPAVGAGQPSARLAPVTPVAPASAADVAVPALLGVLVALGLGGLVRLRFRGVDPDIVAPPGDLP